MYQKAYAEVLEDSVDEAKSREGHAFDRAIELLVIAARKGRYSTAAVEAIAFTRNLWTMLIDDLGSSENRLAAELRANLISIGVWVLGETDKIRRRLSSDFFGIIEVMSSIRKGLA
jgi:flagellar protein FlaF